MSETVEKFQQTFDKLSSTSQLKDVNVSVKAIIAGVIMAIDAFTKSKIAENTESSAGNISHNDRILNAKLF